MPFQLGLRNFHLLNLALRCKWAWLQRVDPTKTCSEFDLNIPKLSRSLFDAATHVVLGNGEKALFWKDRWLNGSRLVDIALNLVRQIGRAHV